MTSSAEQGTGTWDSCIRRGGNQIIQFAVPSAKVYTTSYIKSNTTIDGCANGQHGVTLEQPADRHRSVAIEGPVSNVVVRCIRFQGTPESASYPVEDDLLRLDGTGGQVSRVVVDHCTFVSSTDGALDITGSVSDVTASWNLLYGTPLTQLVKYATRQRISLHHNVYTANGERNPQIKGDARDVDFVSNAIYNQTITVDGAGNTYNPYGTRLWNTNATSDSPGNVRANLRSNFYAGAHSGIGITIEAGASAAGIYIGPDNVCDPGGCDPSPAGAPNAVPAAYAVTATPVACMASRMLPVVGSPNRSAADQAKLDAVGAALPAGCDASAHTVTVAKAGTGSGTVTSSPAGISCGADCWETYARGTVVTLGQSAAAGSHFAGWSGACTGGSCQVTMDAEKSVVGTFDLDTYALTVVKAGAGSGTVTSSPAGISCGADCYETYAHGTVVTLSQAAVAGSSFSGWSGACSGTGTCQVTIDAAKSVTATFNTSSGPYTLNVTKDGTGTGSVNSSPSGISCGNYCSKAYASATVVSLYASTATGSLFGGWSGACTGTGTCQVTMDSSKSVTASFVKSIPTLTVVKAGGGSGTVTSSPAGIHCDDVCTASYSVGTVVTLTAKVAKGSAFGGWTGPCSGTGTCRVTMDQSKRATATFTVSNAGDFYTIVPCRLLDTRNATGPYGGPALAAGASRTISAVGRCGIPSTARALAVNLTATQATVGGNLRLYAADVPAPFVSALNYAAKKTRSNALVVGLSSSGALAIRCAQSSGTVHAILDVTGYYE